MPELAEVEHYRTRWNIGVGKTILNVRLHREKRIFRGVDAAQLQTLLPGARLLESRSHGKLMIFRFSRDLWLGIHLGMTGKLFAAPFPFEPGKHDHLVLCQREQALVFHDPRVFGRILFDRTPNEPEWWATLPPSPHATAFTLARMKRFFQRHQKLSIKPALLLQDGFPGIGNWMADEILWRAALAPQTKVGSIDGATLLRLWRTTRAVSRAALKHISPALADPPAGWLFHERWHRDGKCPIHRAPLRRETIGGRTTVWCPECQALARP